MRSSDIRGGLTRVINIFPSILKACLSLYFSPEVLQHNIPLFLISFACVMFVWMCTQYLVFQQREEGPLHVQAVSRAPRRSRESEAGSVGLLFTRAVF